MFCFLHTPFFLAKYWDVYSIKLCYGYATKESSEWIIILFENFFAHENISLESCAQLSQIRNGIFRNSSEEINLRSFHIALMRYSEALLITALSSILRRGRHQVHTWGAPE